MTDAPSPRLNQGQAEHATRPATLADVAQCYRVLLGREMESREVGAQHLSNAPDLWSLIGRFARSPETALQKVFTASRYIQATQDASSINLALTDIQRTELARHIEDVWRRYGREDPYFSVLTHPSYRSHAITPAALEHFYRTGAIELEAFHTVCRRNGVEVTSDWTVCELGCGVARVGVAFAREFKAYRGVDISTEHLILARERLDAQGFSSARLQLLPDFLEDGTSFDLFYSALVLQHNPPPVIHQLLDTSLAKLNPGGYAYFQVPCYLSGYSYDTGAYLAGEGRKDEMELHALPQGRVFALLAKHGLTPIEVVPDGSIGPIGFSYAFFARKASVR